MPHLRYVRGKSVDPATYTHLPLQVNQSIEDLKQDVFSHPSVKVLERFGDNLRSRPLTREKIRVLLAFFLILLCASMGIVVLVVTDLTGPIRELERRADAMAHGDLVHPVVAAAGEADEVGRLTYAFEQMRRALNDALPLVRGGGGFESIVGPPPCRRRLAYSAREGEINQITAYVILLDNLLAK